MIGRWTRAAWGAAGLLAVLGALATAPAAGLPKGFHRSTVVEGLVAPTAVSFAPGGRIFVAEQSGLIRTVRGLGDRNPSVFADLRPEVHGFFERGLLGMTIDPKFPKRPYLYVLYARDAPIGGTTPTWGAPQGGADDCPTPPGATADGCVVSGRLARLTAKGGRLKAIKAVVDDWCQQYPSHSVGDLAFGASGALYASGGEGAGFEFLDYGQDGSPPNPCGDPPTGVGGQQTAPTAEGGSLRSQDLRTTGDPVGLSGSLIRVDPRSGESLPGNPLGSSGDPNARRIVAHGFRSPFRIAVRPGTDEVWVANVGSDYYEEIDRVLPGVLSNSGWPCYEGPEVVVPWDELDMDLCESLYEEQESTGQAVAQPYFTYGRDAPVIAGDGCQPGHSALAGMAFYPGGGFPSSYDGALFFADFARQCIWVMRAGADGIPSPAAIEPFMVGGASPVDLELGPGGLYYVDALDGELGRISYAGSRPARAVLRTSRRFGGLPLKVRFNARRSRGPGGRRLRYAWDLDGDGRFDDSHRRGATRVYRERRAVTVALRVRARGGGRDVARTRIFPGDTPPVPVIRQPGKRLRWTANEAIRFAASVRDREDGRLPAKALDWELLLRHCRLDDPCHTHPLQRIPGVRRGRLVAPEHEYPSFLKLRVTATDSDGLAVREQVRLRPRTARVLLESQPSGLVLGLNDDYGPTPVTRTVIVGARFTLTAPSPQELAGTTYEWQSWSDGGARSHEVVAGDDLAVGASFTPGR